MPTRLVVSVVLIGVVEGVLSYLALALTEDFTAAIAVNLLVLPFSPIAFAFVLFGGYAVTSWSQEPPGVFVFISMMAAVYGLCTWGQVAIFRALRRRFGPRRFRRHLQ